jgi:hypothetical protein|tara:strand:+ start:1643 stop:2056 length:414 start_codon:yes stop_codon:yes gene_type:complete
MTKNIWDWLKQINYIKADPSSFSDKDWDIWNSYMVHRFISMNQDYVDIVNEVQQINPQNKKEIYTIYREYIPKNNKWNKYIKSNVKQYKSDLLKHLSQYWECSQSEVKEYLNFLDNDEILRILNRLGIQQKEINQLL